MLRDFLEWVDRQPFALLASILFCWIFLRAQIIYWVGRGAAGGALGSRLAGFTAKPRMLRAREVFTRVGWPLIPFSFLVAGLLFATQLTAGIMRMPWHRYLAAMIPGCILWAVMSATIGTLAVSALLSLSEAPAGVRWATLAGVVVFIAVVVWLIRAKPALRRQDP